MVLSMERWVGKIAVVTGASSGIGASIADALATNGVIVVGVARRTERIEARSKTLKGKLYALKADMTIESEIVDAFKWITSNLGLVHILVNCAGFSKEGSLASGDVEAWRKVFDVNVIGLCVATKEAVTIMKKNNIKGHVIHINSILGHSVKNASGVNVYPASKFAVTALTETLQLELLGTPIKITSISPGFVVTEMTLLRDDISEERRKAFGSRPSLDVEDIADGVLYALSTPEHVQVHELTIKPLGERY